MAICKIARMGHPILRKISEPVPVESITSPEVQDLVRDLVETVIDADGAGLAAPQIHVSKRVVILRFNSSEQFQVWINPKITPLTEERLITFEGCLSVPDLRGAVPRCAHVRVNAYDGDGQPFEMELTDYPAIVAQHECDHLDGILYIDKALPSTLSFLKEYHRYQDVLWDALTEEEQ